MIKGGKNMSKGREWEVCMRRNGKAMMKVNVEPIIYDKDMCISALYWHCGWKGKIEVLSLKKSQVKNAIKISARYLAYFDNIEDAPHSREQLILDNERYPDSWSLEIWDTCQTKIEMTFPEFDFIGDRNES